MASNNTISHGDMHIALSQLAHGSISLAKSMEALHSLALAAITHSRDPTKHEDVLKNLAAKLKSIQDEQKRVYEGVRGGVLSSIAPAKEMSTETVKALLADTHDIAKKSGWQEGKEESLKGRY